MTKRRLTTMRRDPVDDQAIAQIRERWGLPSDNAAISMAVRLVATAQNIAVIPAESVDRLLAILADEVKKNV